MAIIDTYSKRQRQAERGTEPDVYLYDILPSALRVQIVHIMRDAIGTDGPSSSAATRFYISLEEMLSREFGVFSLGRGDPKTNLSKFIVEGSTEQVIDAIEVIFRMIERKHAESGYIKLATPRQRAASAIEELNGRFKEHTIGFRYEGGNLIRIDSEYTHAEITKPALALLRDPQFAGAEKEFRNAHDHYREGSAEEAITDALKAFESTMKSIFVKRGWTFGETDPA
jgi:hypothetical protein